MHELNLKKAVDSLLCAGKEIAEVVEETGAAYAYVAVRRQRLKNYAARREAAVLDTIRQIARSRPTLPVGEVLEMVGAGGGSGSHVE